MATTANPYADMESAVASNFNIDPTWFQALGTVESTQTPTAVSGAGAVGLYQIMPSNFASTGLDATSALDPQQNAQAGASIFSQMLKAAGGDYWLATVYYNCGPGKSCNAGINEANKVQSESGMSPLDFALNTPSSDGGAIVNGNVLTGTTTAASAQASGGSWWSGLIARGGFIAVGAILVILAMVIPNRNTIVQVAAKAAA
jgi:hypothetical protein